MNTYVQDHQSVGETVATLFTLVPGDVDAQVQLQNTGVNTVNYRFQELISGVWTDMGTLGTDTYNTLSPDQVKLITLSSTAPKVQLVGNASGGATLDFSITRYFDRGDGGAVPLLSF